MIQSTRFWLLALFALAVTPISSPALAQQDADDPFSVVQRRPAAQDQTAVDTPVYAPAGAFLSREAYLAARGETAEPVLRTRWRIERFDLDGAVQSTETREVVIGDGYVTEATDPGAAVIDFKLERILTRVATLTGPVMRNRPIIGHVHRPLYTFTF